MSKILKSGNTFWKVMEVYELSCIVGGHVPQCFRRTVLSQSKNVYALISSNFKAFKSQLTEVACGIGEHLSSFSYFPKCDEYMHTVESCLPLMSINYSRFIE